MPTTREWEYSHGGQASTRSKVLLQFASPSTFLPSLRMAPAAAASSLQAQRQKIFSFVLPPSTATIPEHEQCCALCTDSWLTAGRSSKQRLCVCTHVRVHTQVLNHTHTHNGSHLNQGHTRTQSYARGLAHTCNLQMTEHSPALLLQLLLLCSPALGDCARHRRHAVHKLGAEDDVRVVEHALLQSHTLWCSERSNYALLWRSMVFVRGANHFLLAFATRSDHIFPVLPQGLVMETQFFFRILDGTGEKPTLRDTTMNWL